MNNVSKSLLGALTFAPIIYMVLFFAHIFSFDSGGLIDFDILFRLHILFMIWIMGLMIYYIIHIFRSNELNSEKRILWTIIVFFGHVIALPFYWYLHIWKSNNEKP